MQQPDGEIPPCVAELVVAVPLQQKDAMFLPLYRLPPRVFCSPNAGQALTLDDVNDLVYRQFERGQGLAGRNLTNAGFDDSFLSH